MQIKHLEIKNQEFRNIKFNGISVKAFLNGAANAGSTSVDFSKSTMLLTLIRDGKTHVIYSGNLKVIGLASCLDTLAQSAFATTQASSQQIGSGQQALVSFTVPLGGPIDLHGDDIVYIEVNNNAGLFTSQALEPSSYLEVKPVKCYGIERFIPKIETRVIQANEQSNQYMIGDNLIKLAILNYDKTDYTQNVINNLVFSSDRLDETYTFADLISRKIERFGKQLIPVSPDVSLQIQEDQSFIVTDMHEEFDAVQLELNFNGANVTAGNNYIVFWTYYTDWTMVAKADAKAESINASTAKKLDEVKPK